MDHKEVRLLALATEPDDLKKEPEPTAIFAGPMGAANGLVGVARLTKARHQLDGSPSYLVNSQATIKNFIVDVQRSTFCC